MLYFQQLIFTLLLCDLQNDSGLPLGMESLLTAPLVAEDSVSLRPVFCLV